MFNFNVLAFVGIAFFAVLTLAPVFFPVMATFVDSMQLIPHRY